MAQFTVRNLEEEVKIGLKQRAARHGCSFEEEVRRILRAAAQEGTQHRGARFTYRRILYATWLG